MNRDEFTNQEAMINVGDGHELWAMDWGFKGAKTPIIYLHGGPGSCAKEWKKQLFNPRVHRVIFFDQRGCGKSTPYGSRENNTTQKLAEDITKIAEHFGIEKFILHGYSWGSCLGLYYAIEHPERLEALVIGGVFSGSRAEIYEMFDMGKIFYPDLWDKVLADTPAGSRDDPIAYHLDKSLNGSAEEQKKSTYVMDYLESGLAKLDDRDTPDAYEEYGPASVQIEMSYMATNCFMPEDYLLENVSKISVPTYIVQGRYDLVCTPDFAYNISKLIPDCKLYFTISNHFGEHENTNMFRSIFDLLA